MAKVNLANVDPRAFIEARGRLMLSDTKHGPVVSKWPRKRGPATSGYNYYRQQEFGLVAKWAASPLDLDLGTAVEMAKGTEQVPRDILMMAAMGVYYDIIGVDGLHFESARMTTNAQYILDQVTAEPGYMLLRQPIGWVGLGPGQPGQVLSSSGEQPIWTFPAAVASGLAAAQNTWSSVSSANYATKGVVMSPVVPFTIQQAYGRVGEIAGARYRWSLVRLFPTYVIDAVISQTPEWTAAATATKATAAIFPPGAQLAPGSLYALLLSRTDATANTNNRLHTGFDDARGLPVDQTNTQIYFQSVDPAPAQVPIATPANPYSHGVVASVG